MLMLNNKRNYFIYPISEEGTTRNRSFIQKDKRAVFIISSQSEKFCRVNAKATQWSI